MEAARRVQISFDEQNQIRLLDPDSFKATEALAEESVSFVGKIDEFAKNAEALVDLLAAQAAKIEQQKLLAIGQRTRATNEAEARKSSRQKELQGLIDQKQLELDRLRSEFEGLQKIEQEQRALIDRLVKR